PRTLSPPWHFTQCSTRRGRISFSKNSRPGTGGAAWSVLPPARAIPSTSDRRKQVRYIELAPSSLVLEPILRDCQRPDLAAEGLSVPPGHPNLVLENVGGMLVAGFPDYLGTQRRPLLAVAGVPDVAP